MPNYASLFNSPEYSTQVQMPLSYEDRVDLDDVYGPPDDWDYRTAQQGWNGEDLPTRVSGTPWGGYKTERAVGWTPYGEPYWGGANPWEEWYKGIQYRLNKDVRVDTANVVQERNDASAAAINNLLEGNFKEAFATGFGAFIRTFTDVIPSRLTGGDKETGEVDYGAPSGLARFSRATGEVLRGFGETFGVVGRGTKQVLSTIEGTLEEGGEGSELLQGAESASLGDPLFEAATREGALPENFGGNILRFGAGINKLIDPIDWTWDAVRTVSNLVTGRKSWDDIKSSAEMNWQAGRVAYSAFIDPAVKEEYKRRYAAGENAYLLELELANPIAEAIGETLLDPLEMYGVWAKGRGVARTYKSTADYLGTAAKETKEYVDIIKEGKRFTPQNLKRLSQQVTRSTQRLSATFDDFDRGRGLLNLSAAGQRNHVNRIFNTIVPEIVRHVGNSPDQVTSALKAIAQLSGTEEQVAEGLTILTRMGLPLDTMLSDGALRMSKVMHTMVTNADGVWDAAKLTNAVKKSDNVADLFKNVGKIYDDATASIFPRLSERAAKELNIGEKMLRTLEGVSDNRAVRWINNSFAQLYMGMSPGYAARNWITNNVHIFVDHGLKPWFDGGEFISMKKVDSFLESYYGGADLIPENLARGLGAAGEFGSKEKRGNAVMNFVFGNLERSSRFEVGASKRIAAYSIKRSMRRLASQALNGAELARRGFSNDEILTLQNHIINAGYDVAKGVGTYMDEVGAESSNILRSMTWVEPDDIAGLEEYGLYDRFAEIIGNKESTMEDILNQVDEMMDETRRYGNNIADDVTPFPMGSEEVLDEDALYAIRAYERNSGYNEITVGMYRKMRYANQIFEENMGRLAQDVASAAKHVLGEEGYNQLLAKGEGYQAMLDGDWIGITNRRHRNFVDSVVYHSNRLKDYEYDDVVRMFDELRIPGRPPPGMTNQEYKNFLWDGFFRPESRSRYAAARDTYAQQAENFMSDAIEAANEAGVELFDTNMQQSYKRVLDSWEDALQLDGAIHLGQDLRYLTPEGRDNFAMLTSLAFSNGIPTITPSGAKNPYLMNLIRQHAGDQYADLGEVPVSVLHDVLKAEKGDDYVDVYNLGARAADDIPEFHGLGQNIDRVVGVYDQSGGTISNFAPYFEAQAGLGDLRNRLRKGILDNYGQYRKIVHSEEQTALLMEWVETAKTRMFESRVMATDVAIAQRNFALLDYQEKRNIDLITSLVYPYQYWYGRTYANWMKRIAQQPHILASYHRYKETLSKIHAGAPEWWRYNVNTNELLGLDSKHPLYFNLEATLNPLNGLTGVDFDDSYKRTGWWTKLLDGLGRFGPSVHPALQYTTALGLLIQGEEEAAARWGGRLSQLSSVTQAIGSVAGADTLTTLEWDPATWLFADGVDPYMRNRVGRALAQLYEDGRYSQEEIIEAARTQTGEIWEQARILAAGDRDYGQLASYFVGVGFKARNEGDLLTDQMYSDFWRLMEQRHNLSPEEFRQGMDDLGRMYPFMDTVMIARKAGAERDAAYAYSVLGRIAPGQTSQIFDSVGLDKRLVDRFYEDKGDMSDWPEADRLRFMSAAVDMGATLAIPDGTTQTEWDAARTQYRNVLNLMEEMFGRNIHDKIDMFYAIKAGEGDEAANQYLQENPNVARAMDAKTQMIIHDPTGMVSAYYSSVNKIESYYRGWAYGVAEQRFGEDIFDLSKQYSTLSTNEKRNFLRQNPQLREYWDFMDEIQNTINESVARVASNLPEGIPTQVRSDLSGAGVAGQDLAEQLQQPQDPLLNITTDQWLATLGERVYGLVLDALRGERSLSRDEEQAIQRAAEQVGLQYANQLIQYVGISVYRLSN